MLFTNLSHPLATTGTHHHQISLTHLHPLARGCSSKLSEAQTYHCFHRSAARAQTQESNGELGDSNKQPPKKPSALMNAFERAAAYKKSLGKTNPPTTDEGATKPSLSSADRDVTMKNQRSNEGVILEEVSQNAPASPLESKPSPSSTELPLHVKPNEGVLLEEVSQEINSLKSKQESEMASALAAKAELRKAEREQADSSQSLEVEIITRDGIIRRKVSRPGDSFSKAKGPKRTGVSSSDFIGLGFSEKKSTSKGALPAGLAVGLEAPPPGSMPEVEIITRDGKTQQSSKDGLYKPKVVTWGIFERPADISQTNPRTQKF